MTNLCRRQVCVAVADGDRTFNATVQVPEASEVVVAQLMPRK